MAPEPGLLFAQVIGIGSLSLAFFIGLYVFCDTFYGGDDGQA